MSFFISDAMHIFRFAMTLLAQILAGGMVFSKNLLVLTLIKKNRCLSQPYRNC